MPKSTFYHLQDKKQNRIIQGAMEAFDETSYRQVTIDRIVQLAGIPKGSFYQYFQNKDDLFTYIFGELGDEKKEILESVIDQIPNCSFVSFVALLLLQVKTVENRDATMVGLKKRFLQECPQAVKKEIMKSIIPKSDALFETIVRAYQEKGEFRADLHTKDAAYLLTSAITQLDHYAYDENEQYEDTVKRLLKMLTIGFRREDSDDTDS